MAPPKSYPRRGGYSLSVIIYLVTNRFRLLASLGRTGQWVLHHEDLYLSNVDTQPPSRDPTRKIHICDLKHNGKPVEKYTNLIWAGRGPVPNLTSFDFWADKLEDIEAKLEQAENDQVYPQLAAPLGFTPSEIQALESMENQKQHLVCMGVEDNARVEAAQKTSAFLMLMAMAQMGRAGQWILHNEDLYSPLFDTRPQTRKPGTGVVVQGLYQVDYCVRELVWDGKGLQPNLTSHVYWLRKTHELRAKKDKVWRGQVQPNFTAEELRVLESLEQQKDHYFAECAQLRRDVPLPPPVTPALEAAAKQMTRARQRLIALMQSIWDLGLPGQWILHLEDLFCPESDTRRRCRNSANEDDSDENTYTVPAVQGLGYASDLGLRYTGGLPLPDFNDLAYWKNKYAALEAKREDVRAGRVQHHFTVSELATLQLAERDRETQYLPDAANQKLEGVKAWLNIEQKTPQSSEYGVSPTVSVATTPDSARSTSPETPSPSAFLETRKRRRPAEHKDSENDREGPTQGEASRPTKRSRTQQHIQQRSNDTRSNGAHPPAQPYPPRQAAARNPSARRRTALAPSNDSHNRKGSMPEVPTVSAGRRPGNASAQRKKSRAVVAGQKRVEKQTQRRAGRGNGCAEPEAHAGPRRSPRLAALAKKSHGRPS